MSAGSRKMPPPMVMLTMLAARARGPIDRRRDDSGDVARAVKRGRWRVNGWARVRYFTSNCISRAAQTRSSGPDFYNAAYSEHRVQTRSRSTATVSGGSSTRSRSFRRRPRPPSPASFSAMSIGAHANTSRTLPRGAARDPGRRRRQYLCPLGRNRSGAARCRHRIAYRRHSKCRQIRWNGWRAGGHRGISCAQAIRAFVPAGRSS